MLMTQGLARSTVVPYLQRIEKMLSGMLVRKPIRLDDVSDLVREQLFDVDLEGNDLECLVISNS